MKKSKFTESQIASILKEVDADVPVGGLVRKHGISTTTYFNGKLKRAGVAVSELKRMRELEPET